MNNNLPSRQPTSSARTSRQARGRSPSSRFIASLRDRYLGALIAGDPAAVREVVVEALQQGLPAQIVYVDILSHALIQVGEMWHRGELTVAHEHRSTQMTLDQMAFIRDSLVPERTLDLRALVTAVENELHLIGARMVADFLLLEGWRVDFLGADTPTADLIRFAEQNRPDLVALSVTQEANVESARHAVAALRALPEPPKVLVGGAAVFTLPKEDTLGADQVAMDIPQVIGYVRQAFGIGADATTLEAYLGELGGRINELRSRRGWSQQKLAEEAGLDRTYISAVEHGRQNLTLGAVKKMGDALDVSLLDLLTGRS